MSSSVGRIIPYIMEHKKRSKPPTRYTYMASLSLETRYLFWVNLMIFNLWENWVKICFWSCANIVAFGGNLRLSWQSMGVLNMKNTLLLLVSHEPLHFLRMDVRVHDLPLESVEELNGPKAEFPFTVHRFPEKAALQCRIFSSTPNNSSIIPSGNHGRGWKTANFVNRRRALRLSAPSWCLIPALVGHYPGPGTVQPRFAGFGGLQGPEKYMKFTYRTIPWIMDWTSKIMETRWCPRYLFIGYQWPWGSVACWSSWTLPAVAHQVTGNNKLETHQNKFHLVSSSSITFVLFRFWHIHQQRMSRSCLLRNMRITCRCRDHAKCDYMFEDGWWYYVLGMVYL